jgi:hypothetical protein
LDGSVAVEAGLTGVVIHLSALVHKMELILLVAGPLSASGDKVEI